MLARSQTWCALFELFFCIIMVHTHPEIYNPVPILSSLNPVPILHSMLIQYRSCSNTVNIGLIRAWQWTVLYCGWSGFGSILCWIIPNQHCKSMPSQDCSYTVWYQDLQSLPNQYRILKHGSCDFLDTAWKNKKLVCYDSKSASIAKVSHIVFLSLVCIFYGAAAELAYATIYQWADMNGYFTELDNWRFSKWAEIHCIHVHKH